jgi:hypothetical protein
MDIVFDKYGLKTRSEITYVDLRQWRASVNTAMSLQVP